MSSIQFALISIVWIGIVLLVVKNTRQSSLGSSGLPVAYVLIFSLIHFGAVIYILPWYDPGTSRYLISTGVSRASVGTGFLMSLLGLAGFYVGNRIRDGRGVRDTKIVTISPERSLIFSRRLILIGVFFFVVVFRVARYIPSGHAIVGAGVHLVTIGVALGALVVLNRRSNVSKSVSIMQIAGIPVVTMLSLGFLSYGVSSLIVICSFLLPFLRVRKSHVLVSMPIAWLLLSFYVTYMGARGEIRSSVFRDNYIQRIATATDLLFWKFEFFSVGNNPHLHRIDSRLNQNSFVGLAVKNTGGSSVPFANGKTIYFAAVAWIPRSLWPGKPEFGGSGDLVAHHTGLTLSKSSSFGAGQVLEFYVNFGAFGVFGGFVLLGMALRHLDLHAALELRRGNLTGFTGYFLVGICVIQPQGILAEIVASAAAGCLIMYGMNKFSPDPTGRIPYIERARENSN